MVHFGAIGLLVWLPGALDVSAVRVVDDDVRRAIDHILFEWRCGDQGETEAVVSALVALGRPASPELCRLLDERPPEDLPVEALATAIGRLGSVGALPTLGRLSESKLAGERLAALDALGVIDVRECLLFIVRALDDEAPEVADHAEALLLGSAQQTTWVVLSLTERMALACDKGRIGRILGRIPGDEAHQALIDMLDGIGDAAVLCGLQGLWYSGRLEDGPAVARPLRGQGSVGIQKQACLVLGKIRAWSEIPDLVAALVCADRGVRANAHWALVEITGLGLKAEQGLWQQWWDRRGSKRSGSTGPSRGAGA